MHKLAALLAWGEKRGPMTQRHHKFTALPQFPCEGVVDVDEGWCPPCLSNPLPISIGLFATDHLSPPHTQWNLYLTHLLKHECELIQLRPGR